MTFTDWKPEISSAMVSQEALWCCDDVRAAVDEFGRGLYQATYTLSKYDSKKDCYSAKTGFSEEFCELISHTVQGGVRISFRPHETARNEYICEREGFGIRRSKGRGFVLEADRRGIGAKVSNFYLFRLGRLVSLKTGVKLRLTWVFHFDAKVTRSERRAGRISGR